MKNSVQTISLLITAVLFAVLSLSGCGKHISSDNAPDSVTKAETSAVTNAADTETDKKKPSETTSVHTDTADLTTENDTAPGETGTTPDITSEIADTTGKTPGETSETDGTSEDTTAEPDADYPVRELTVCGNPVSEYTILYDGSFRSAADNLQKTIHDLCGITLPVKSGRKADTKHSILFCYNSPVSSAACDFTICSKKGDVIIDGVSDASESIMNCFYGVYLYPFLNGSETVDMPISEKKWVGFITLDDFNLARDGYNQIAPVKTSETKIAAGVVYSKLEYKDTDGKPVVAHIVTAAPGSVTVECGTPGAKDSGITSLTTVSEQINSAESKYGYDIISAVNGDLFYWEGNKLLARSKNVKNGTTLFENTGDFRCFAVLNDGTFFVGNPDAVPAGSVRQMIGGHRTAVENGHIVYHNRADDFTYTRHPRTALGYKEDGTLVMAVIDGRQPSVSNGASLHDLGEILQSLGVIYAVNLDGGGSSILYTKNLADEKFIVRNSPCEKNPYRSVLTTAFFVFNPDYKG